MDLESDLQHRCTFGCQSVILRFQAAYTVQGLVRVAMVSIEKEEGRRWCCHSRIGVDPGYDHVHSGF
jgi:hypothetical protein